MRRRLCTVSLHRLLGSNFYIRATGYPGYSATGDRWAVTGNVNKQQETVGISEQGMLC